jgi:hypothetical protein
MKRDLVAAASDADRVDEERESCRDSWLAERGPEQRERV